MIVAIVAHDINRIIGNKGKLPWHLPEDLKLFKKMTEDHAVLMGRNTWDSLPDKFKPLPKRTNIVLTSKRMNSTKDLIGPYFINSWEGSLELAKKLRPEKDIFVIGGSYLYDYSINKAKEKVNKIFLSLVKGEYKGDVYFPELEGNWSEKVLSVFDNFEFIEKIRDEQETNI